MSQKIKKSWLLLFIFLSVFSCRKGSVNFNMNYDAEVVVSSGTSVNLPVSLMTPPVTSNSSANFENNNTRADLVESILLKTLHIYVKSPQGDDFSFLKSVEIYISADGVPESRIAFKNDIQDNVGNQMDLDLDGTELKNYLVKESFTLKSKVVTDKLLTHDLTVGINSAFAVKAKVL